MAVASPNTAGTADAPHAARRIQGMALFSVLAALMLTLLLEALDQTIVGTAMPRIIAQLHGFDRYIWVVIAYTLASTTVIPVVGALSDQFGRKGFLITGVVLFLLGSALSGAAQTMTQLIAFRALQGFGAGVGIALVFTVMADIFPPQERAKWGGLFGGVYGLSNLIGPTLGGWLTDHGPLLGTLVTNTTRWRWVFYINLPLGIVALIALMIYLPAHLSPRGEHRGWAAIRRIDIPGALLGTAATICLLLGLTWGGNETYAWASPQVIGMLAASVVLALLFLWVERSAAEPILPLALFRNRVFAAAAILSLLQIMVLVGLVIYLPLFLQAVLGESATYSGMLITPLTLSSVFGATISGILMGRLGRYQVLTIAGAVVMGAGVLLLSRMTATTSPLTAALFMIIAGVGLGSFFSILPLVAQNAVPRRQLGAGTAVARYLGQLGAVLGVAIVGTVVNHTIESEMAHRVPAQVARQLTPAGLKAASNPQVLINAEYRHTLVQTAQHIAVTRATAHIPPGPQRAAVAQQVAAQVAHTLDGVFAALAQALMAALQNGFAALLITCAVAVVATFFLKDVPLSAQYPTES